MLCIYNARIILPTGIYPGRVIVREDRIDKVEIGIQEMITSVEGEQICGIDACGKYLSPGFMDIHTHGAGGMDFMDGDAQSIYGACCAHLQHGTTSIVPTTIASTPASLHEFVALFNTLKLEQMQMPHILGMHLEGPYFACGQRGAQAKEHLRNPAPDEYMAVLEQTERIIRWSFAVELPGADEFLAELCRRGIVPSLAHSSATCKQTIHAYNCGVRALTHFYSGMESVHREHAFRVAGAVEAGYLLDDLYVEVIADGCHLPSELLQLIYKVKGPDRICLVTDSMRGAGMPNGHYRLGNRETGLETIVEDGVAKLLDRSAFAGSVATADRLVRTMYRLTTAPLHECVKMMTLTPARLLGLDGMYGSICPGKKADLLIFDEDITIDRIFVAGQEIQQRK